MADGGAGTWQLRLLDHFALRGPDGDVTLSSRKTMALLVYLALQRDRAARRDAIAALLWEDVDPTQARNNLRQSLAILRKLDAAGSIVQDATVDTIRLSSTMSVDIDSFNALAEDDPATAIGLYKADLMAGFVLANAPSFNEWLAVVQAHWRQRMVGAALRVVTGALEPDGDLNAGASAALQLLTVDPYNEAGHRALMRIYARQGRSALAISQYRALADLLRGDLGIVPEAETTRLHDELRTARRTTRREPVARTESSTPIAPATDQLTAAEADRPRCIAVVDDEPNLREAIATYLRLHGFDVVECATGAALDTAIAAGSVDLIVLDVNMPGEDGFSIARRIGAANRVPIVMLTARTDLIDRVVGLELGADDYLGKPFELRELLARIRAILRRLPA